MKYWTLIKVESETEPKCWHCGTRIKYACWIRSNEGEELCVGKDCCSNFLSVKKQKTVNDKCAQILKYAKIKNQYNDICSKHNPDMSKRVLWLYSRINFSTDIAQSLFPAEFAYYNR